MQKISIMAVNQLMAQQCALDLTKLFGGATITPKGTGYWQDSQGQTIQDDNYTVWSLCDDNADISVLNYCAEEYKAQYNQDAVLWLVEPVQPHFV